MQTALIKLHRTFLHILNFFDKKVFPLKLASHLSFHMPAHACNAHLHIIDPAFPNDGNANSMIGTVDTYRKIADELCLPRAVFVQAKPFALDNTCLLDAIQKFGVQNARGIAVVNSAVTDRELEDLHAAGVRGLRFSVWNPQNAVVSFEDCFPLSERCKHLGWNMQLHMSASQLFLHADTIRKLDCRIVVDHMGRMNPKLGIKDPAYPFLLEMIDCGNTWVKTSGPYLNTSLGKPWEDATSIAVGLANYAPERIVWGSDFPHVTERDKPSELDLANLISVWFPTAKARQLALVDNPAQLYGF